MKEEPQAVETSETEEKISETNSIPETRCLLSVVDGTTVFECSTIADVKELVESIADGKMKFEVTGELEVEDPQNPELSE